MSNEELAVLIQNGQEEYIMELWGQVRRMAYKMSLRWGAALGQYSGVTIDDLMQSAFLGLLQAIPTYREGAPFLGWFILHAKTEMGRYAGVRTRKTASDPIRTAVSISQPLTGDRQDSGELTMEDVLPDPAAAAALEETENSDRLDIWELVDTLPGDQRDAIRKKYIANQTLTKAERGALVKGIRALRSPKLREYVLRCR